MRIGMLMAVAASQRWWAGWRAHTGRASQHHGEGGRTGPAKRSWKAGRCQQQQHSSAATSQQRLAAATRLAAVGVGPRIGHGQQAGPVVPHSKALVLEGAAVNRLAARACGSQGVWGREQGWLTPPHKPARAWQNRGIGPGQSGVADQVRLHIP